MSPLGIWLKLGSGVDFAGNLLVSDKFDRSDTLDTSVISSDSFPGSELHDSSRSTIRTKPRIPFIRAEGRPGPGLRGRNGEGRPFPAA